MSDPLVGVDRMVDGSNYTPEKHQAAVDELRRRLNTTKYGCDYCIYRAFNGYDLEDHLRKWHASRFFDDALPILVIEEEPS